MSNSTRRTPLRCGWHLARVFSCCTAHADCCDFAGISLTSQPAGHTVDVKFVPEIPAASVTILQRFGNPPDPYDPVGKRRTGRTASPPGFGGTRPAVPRRADVAFQRCRPPGRFIVGLCWRLIIHVKARRFQGSRPGWIGSRHHLPSESVASPGGVWSCSSGSCGPSVVLVDKARSQACIISPLASCEPECRWFVY